MHTVKDTVDGLAMGNWDRLARYTDTMGPDYDYSKVTNGHIDSRGHMDDIGKLPWHPTFSQGSTYGDPSSKNFISLGGVWEGNNYRPSVQMINNGNGKGLSTYMLRAEPNSKILTPIPMNRAVFNNLIK